MMFRAETVNNLFSLHWQAHAYGVSEHRTALLYQLQDGFFEQEHRDPLGGNIYERHLINQVDIKETPWVFTNKEAWLDLSLSDH